MAKTAVVVQIPGDSQVAGWLGERSNVGLVGLELANLVGDGSPAALDHDQANVGIASEPNSRNAFRVAARFTPSNLRKRLDW